MLEGKAVAVVVPAHDEEALIGPTLGGIPAFVDTIVVVDDGSADATAERARTFGDGLRHGLDVAIAGVVQHQYFRPVHDNLL